MSFNAQKSMDRKTQEKLGKFLATSGNDKEKMPSSINTRISSSEEMKMFLLADFLGEQGVESAKEMHDSLCQHAISKRGLGRQEVGSALMRVPGAISNRTLPRATEKGMNDE